MLSVRYRSARDGRLRFEVFRDESVMGHIELEIRRADPVTLDDIRSIDLEQVLSSVPRYLTPWLIRPREAQ